MCKTKHSKVVENVQRNHGSTTETCVTNVRLQKKKKKKDIVPWYSSKQPWYYHGKC